MGAINWFRQTAVPGAISEGEVHAVKAPGTDAYIQYIINNSGIAVPPAVLAHGHAMSDIVGLSSALTAKASVVTLTAGDGLTGGGDTSANRTFAVDLTNFSGRVRGASTYVLPAVSASNAAYLSGSFEAFVTNTNYTAGARPGYGFHAGGGFGMYLYGSTPGELRLRTDSGADYQIMHSGNFTGLSGSGPTGYNAKWNGSALTSGVFYDAGGNAKIEAGATVVGAASAQKFTMFGESGYVTMAFQNVAGTVSNYTITSNPTMLTFSVPGILNNAFYINKSDGSSAFSGQVFGLTPTFSNAFATKGYVDGLIAGKANTSHTHVASDITNFVATVRTSISGTGGISYNSSTGVISYSGSSGVTGTGTAGFVPLWGSSTVIGNSVISQSGGNLTLAAGSTVFGGASAQKVAMFSEAGYATLAFQNVAATVNHWMLTGTDSRFSFGIPGLTNDAFYINRSDGTAAFYSQVFGQTPLHSNSFATKGYIDANPGGWITGINGSMVTSALGYTPYSNSNPNGYTSNAGTVTQVGLVVPTGFNVLSSPVTGSGNIQFGFASGYSLVSSTDRNNWNSKLTAFGSEGYLPYWSSSSDLSSTNVFYTGSGLGIGISDSGFGLIVFGRTHISDRGNTGTSTKAVLSLDSVTKGFLTPRMSESEMHAISSPPIGLEVFVDSGTGLGKWCYYGSSSGGWRLLATRLWAGGSGAP